jgi:hypothetical protein
MDHRLADIIPVSTSASASTYDILMATNNLAEESNNETITLHYSMEDGATVAPLFDEVGSQVIFSDAHGDGSK